MFNQQSTSCPCPNSDVSFEYNLNCEPTNGQGVPMTTIDVTVKQLSTIKPNQRVNICGILSIGKKEPKELFLKRSQEKSYVKEDCIIEDETGAMVFHIWHPIIDKLESGKSYQFKNVTVKYFQGSTFLSTCPSTTFSEASTIVADLAGPKLLEDPEQKVEAPNFKFVSKLQIFISCQVCKRRLTDVSSVSCKCQHCGTRQRTAGCKREASVKLCIKHDKTDLWLTAFTNEINKLLQHTRATLQSSVEEIEDELMNIENIQINYNSQKMSIIDISVNGTKKVKVDIMQDDDQSSAV